MAWFIHAWFFASFSFWVVEWLWAVGPFYHGVRPPPVGYSTFNQAVNGGLCVLGTRRRAEAGPSPDWRRSHPGVLSSCLTRPGRHSGRPVAQAEGGYSLGKTRPHTGSLSPPSPQERPAVDAAARLDSARIARVRALVPEGTAHP